MIYYIHGFNSSSKNNINKYNQLKSMFPNENIKLLDYNSFDKFENNFESLKEQINNDIDPFFIGSSLGGYYSNELSNFYNCNSVLINPVTNPKSQLFNIDKNLNINILSSYKQITIKKLPKLLILSLFDDILDMNLTKKLFENKAQIIYTCSYGHRVPDLFKFSKEITFLRNIICLN